jgi:hypothetical protein
MGAIKEQVLREFGDEGADTLRRYFIQIEYTVLWCIRMLNKTEQIDAVIPEGIDDVAIVRGKSIELHQIKTRTESQGVWLFGDILETLSKQYFRRKAFPEYECFFHFVSDGLADNRKSNAKSPEYPSNLYYFKQLLEILHDGQSFNSSEKSIFEELISCLVPRIQGFLRTKFNDDVDEKLAKDLIYKTWIDTNSIELNRDILSELHYALNSDPLSQAQYTTQQLQKIHDQILLLVLRKILCTSSLTERSITKDDVLLCRTSSLPIGNINLDKLPGESNLEKKAYLGGFDVSEIPVFDRQRKQADWTSRRLQVLGVDYELARLTTALLDLQSNSRHGICRKQGISEKPGPQILSVVREGIPDIRKQIFPNHPEVDDQFCLGILWNQTNECVAWWHAFENTQVKI